MKRQQSLVGELLCITFFYIATSLCKISWKLPQVLIQVTGELAFSVWFKQPETIIAQALFGFRIVLCSGPPGGPRLCAVFKISKWRRTPYIYSVIIQSNPCYYPGHLTKYGVCVEDFLHLLELVAVQPHRLLMSYSFTLVLSTKFVIIL